MDECALLAGTRKINSIYFVDNAGFNVDEDAKSIVVRQVAGQGAYVPWFEVTNKDGSCTLVNAAQIATVHYEVDQTEPQ